MLKLFHSLLLITSSVILFACGEVESQNENISSSSLSNSSSSYANSSSFDNSSSSLASSSSLGNSSSSYASLSSSSQTNILDAVQEQEKYTTKDSVAAYIYKFKKLPSNYVNKTTGQAMYEAETGETWTKWNFNPWLILGVMIGGDYYGNNEGLLPSGNYRECDVDYHDSSRGTKRLVYTNAGVVYYTANHYESFSLLYGE